MSQGWKLQAAFHLIGHDAVDYFRITLCVDDEFADSRRKLYELHVAKSFKVATETVERMATLWEVEDTIRGQSPEARVAA